MTNIEKIMARPEVKVLLDMIRLSNLETYRHSFSVASLTEKMLELTPHFTEYEKEQILIGALLLSSKIYLVDFLYTSSFLENKLSKFSSLTKLLVIELKSNLIIFPSNYTCIISLIKQRKKP